MPSDSRVRDARRDERVHAALTALARPIAAYRSAVAGAVERLRGWMVAGGADRTRAELGDFAGGRIDADRFAALSPGAAVPDAEARRRVDRAIGVLAGFVESSDEELFVVDVPAGARLGAVVAESLEELGAVFGAVAAAELVRGGRFNAAQHGALFGGLPFAQWSIEARRVAPPLVLTVDGADLRAAELAEFVDAGARLVLLVRGACAPAPLVRLITPDTFVLQTTDPAQLALAAAAAPSVAAIVPEGAAQFVHDPARGREPWQRLSIVRTPEAPPRRAVGGWSRWQQRQELDQLRAIAQPPSLSDSPMAAIVGRLGDGDATEQLAAWLVRQADASVS